MEITNNEIMELEDKVIKLMKHVETFHMDLMYRGRTNGNFNHLGTLDVNLKVLMVRVNRLIKTLDY